MEVPNRTQAGVLSQTKLLMWKNFLEKRRKAWTTCTEIFLPVMGAILLILIRSAVEIDNTEQSYNLQYNRSLLDPPSIVALYDTIACGETVNSNRVGPRPAFGIAGATPEIRDKLEERLRRQFLDMYFVITNVSSVFTNYTNPFQKDGAYNCSGKSWQCLIPTNADQPECQDAQIHPANILTNINREDFFLQFDDRAAMEKYIKEDDYGLSDATPQLHYGVSFSRTPDVYGDKGSWEYAIHSNISYVPSPLRPVNNLIVGFDPKQWSKYLTGGYILFQAQIDAFILYESEKPSLTNTFQRYLLSMRFFPFPVPNYKTDQFAEYLSSVLGLFLIIFYMWPFSRLVTNIVEEKEKRIKEGMKIMGLRASAFWLSWAFTYLIGFTIISILVTIFTIPVFPYSNRALIFLVFWLFGVSLVPMGLFLSTWFSKAKTAGLVSVMGLFLFFLPSFNVSDDNTSLQVRALASLLSPVSFSLMMTEILSYEAAFVGVQWDNYRETSSNYSLEIGMFFCLIDFFFYAFLAWYLDQVVPGDYGTHEKPWFLCSPRYWCGGSSNSTDYSALQQGDDAGVQIQPVPDSMKDKLGVKTMGLRKVFPSGCMQNTQPHVAVHGLNLSLYEGQIMVLLGHNGAGKTTTINMLSGMLPTSEGTAMVYGKDINNDMKDIRGNLGFCPQHDILFNNLTVKEHLLLYGELKGVPKDQLEETVRVSIEEIQLERATDQASHSLSGGQKRRLSLAISLIGGSKVVFLDEPTSGVDPFSRRAIWDLLNKKKHDRVMILTTHFMDEADQLGDRIAIMHHGKLRCCGTSLFLKNVFGVGYNIVMTRNADANREELGQLITKHVAKAELLSDVGTELAYRLPIASTPSFPEMLVELEDRGKEVGVESFGLSVTTMEEVFLRVANEMSDPHDTTEMASGLKRLSSLSMSSLSKEKRKNNKPRASSMHEDMLKAYPEHATWGRHMKALMKKRYKIAIRDRLQQCCQFAAPMLLLFIGLILLSGGGLGQLPDMPLYPEHLFEQDGKDAPLPINDNYKGPLGGNVVNVGGSHYFASQDGCAFIDEPPRQKNATYTNVSDFSQMLLDSRLDSALSRYGAIFVQGNFLNTTTVNPKSWLDPISIFTNITGIHAIPSLLSIVNTGHLRKKNNNSQDSIRVTTAIWPWTKQQTEALSLVKGLFTSIIVALSLAFIPSSYVAFTVKERSSKAKHLQFISGVSPSAYWLSNYIFDFLTFMLPALGMVVLLVVFKQKAYIGDNLGVVILNLMLYGAAVIPFSYLFSFLFESHTIAQGVMILMYIFAGVVLLITSFVFYNIDSTKDSANTIRMFFRLFPNFCVGDTVFYLSIVDLTNSVTLGNQKITPWDMQISGWDSVFLAWEAPVFFILVLVIEYYSTFDKGLCKKKVPPAILGRGLDKVEDQDVEDEKTRILEGNAQDELVTLQGLRKCFPQKVAVNDLYFSIPRNQCFGFLGVNGAGKSTTLKMMTGDEVPTTGDAYLGGLSILREPIAVRRMMGYCPQFDALHDLLTAEEHLSLYASIRGVPESRLAKMISFLSDRLTLSQDNQHKRVSSTYSGGNKRKLSVGIALIGNPAVVFLDEPSTGMDPVSRRFMWDFINETMTNRAVILTTHSMEECEALCSRIGILVHGRLRCIGSGQHLKNRFGMGFEFLLTVEIEKVDKVREFIRSTFAGANEVECYGGNMKYNLAKQKMKLSEIFRLLEESKEKMGITEYSIGQTTLEQIFIRFASQGDQELAAEAAGVVMGQPVYKPPETLFDTANVAVLDKSASYSKGSLQE